MGVLHAGVRWSTQKVNGAQYTIVYLVHHRTGLYSCGPVVILITWLVNKES